MTELYIGLMSGTSLDGIDAVLVDFSQPSPTLVASHYNEYTPQLRQTILALCHPGTDEINRMGELDVALGKQFALATNTLLKKNHLTAKQIRAIGSHGQTIRHYPQRQFTVQIGDPNIIAAETGITTVADFRRRDIAHGGQGAPLVPAFHQHIFSTSATNRAIVNIGGIANITLLPATDKQSILGFDTGPGNTLLDIWAEKYLHQPQDKNGAWAAQGKIHAELLEKLLADPFFKLVPPKSTGREYFNLQWLENHLPTAIPPVDVQTTLTELTARSIINAISHYFSQAEILICGGGVHNHFLMQRLQKLNPALSVTSTQTRGIDPDWVEAIAFAWLAKQTLAGNPGNITAVTGAMKTTILGGVYYT